MNAPRRILATLRNPKRVLLLWIILLFIASSVPQNKPLKIDFPMRPDTLLHGLMYAVLGALAVQAIWNPDKRRALIAAAIIGAAWYGAMLECWQHFVGRTPSVGDALANAIGAAFGGLVGTVTALYSRYRRRKESRGHGHERDAQTG